MSAANILKPALSPGRDPGHRRHYPYRVFPNTLKDSAWGGVFPACYGG